MAFGVTSRAGPGGEAAGIEAVAGYVAALGAHGRRVRGVVGLLTERAFSLEELVREAAVPRRVVERVLELAGPDLVARDGRYAVAAGLVGAYRERFGYSQLRETRLADPVGERVAARPELVRELGAIVSAAPRGRRELDHVAATPETLARRGLWLDSTYDLAGARVLFVGDHDLTSLATCAANPAVSAVVVDIDEQVLDYIDLQARRLGFDVRCYWGDLRFGLPGEAIGSADVVFTDPPYTPDGVQLFLGRGVQGLRDPDIGRLVLAYGYSELHPGLGWRVQEAVQDLQLVYEAILPAFNRYFGAQAVGSASDLYVCRPTARTVKVVERRFRDVGVNIYTHGEQSLEGGRQGAGDDVAEQVRKVAAGPDGLPVPVWVGDSATLGQVLTAGVPPQFVGRGAYAVAVDLSADPGAWLFRVLLAVNADRVAVLVPNSHADIGSESAQRALGEAVSGKYELRFRRSWPDSRYAVVEAAARSEESPRKAVLGKAFSRVGNSVGEALVKASRRGDGTHLSRREARDIAAARIPTVVDDTLMSLPRRGIGEVLERGLTP